MPTVLRSGPSSALVSRFSSRSAARALTLTLGLLLGGCGGSGGTTTEEPSTGGTDETPAGDSAVLVGSFQVSLVAPQSGTPGYTTVVGKIYDGPTPSQLVWELAAQSGDCKLMTPRVPFCGTPCGGSAVCVEDSVCQAYPTARTVGAVQVKGVRTSTGATEFSMNPVAKNYQPSGSISLPYPAFNEGDTLSLSAAGDYYPAFSVSSRGIVPLTLPDSTLTLQQNQALDVRWSAPGQPSLSKVHVKLDISHHGGTKGMIECDTADTGAMQIAAPLVTQLLNLGVAGYPTIIVTRKAVGSTTIAPGRVDLTVSSEVERSVVVPGVTSCTETSQCPTGKTCQSDLTCR